MKVLRCGLLLAATGFLLSGVASAQVPIPGTGQRMTKVGDDFEDEKWSYTFNNPKSTEENDKQQRLPAGGAVNRRWYEGIMRGHPDVVKRVPTPEGGLPGSTSSLLMVSKQTGVPGHYSNSLQQDDLIVDVSSRLGGALPVSRTPSCVVRVYLPPWEEWERRRGPSFGFRSACVTHRMKPNKKKGRWGGGGSSYQSETYWPGMFIQFNPGDGDKRPDAAEFVVRGGPNGGDFVAAPIKEVGWWTLGMSFTPDGQVHYFAKQGVEDLTAKDHITSQFPYGFRAEHFDTFFFNVCNNDNGQWSTPWIIDDPALYVSTQYARQ